MSSAAFDTVRPTTHGVPPEYRSHTAPNPGPSLTTVSVLVVGALLLLTWALGIGMGTGMTWTFVALLTIVSLVVRTPSYSRSSDFYDDGRRWLA